MLCKQFMVRISSMMCIRRIGHIHWISNSKLGKKICGIHVVAYDQRWYLKFIWTALGCFKWKILFFPIWKGWFDVCDMCGIRMHWRLAIDFLIYWILLYRYRFKANNRTERKKKKKEQRSSVHVLFVLCGKFMSELNRKKKKNYSKIMLFSPIGFDINDKLCNEWPVNHSKYRRTNVFYSLEIFVGRNLYFRFSHIISFDGQQIGFFPLYTSLPVMWTYFSSFVLSSLH